jgi:NADPH-dependent 2,4-dienoyl-CoA reductase/sulfur reductase-like enzyme
MKRKYHIVIAGAGIAGLSAAATLSGHGLDILVIDENPQMGGQLLREQRHPRPWFGRLLPDRTVPAGYRLMNHLRTGSGIQWLFEAQVLGVFEGNRLWVHAPSEKESKGCQTGDVFEIQAETILFAAGARERYLPFKGWTLPNVMSLGAVQILMKSHGVLPAGPTLIAGSSPLMMVLAAEIVSHKGRVAGLVDENTWKDKQRFLSLARHHWPKLVQGAFYNAHLFFRRIPAFQGYRVVEACGKDRFESAVIAKTTGRGILIAGTEKRVKAEVLATGYGFVPNIELPVQAGCDMVFQRDLGGWIIRVGRLCETANPGMFAAGETTGIAGGEKSFLQGRLAAMAILRRMGKTGIGRAGPKFDHDVNRIGDQIRQLNDYAVFLNRLCRVPDDVYAEIADETIICRCEDITMGTLRKNIRNGFDTVSSLKKASRWGMGRCQGRICGPVLFDILTALTSRTPDEIGTFQPRSPVKNVGIKAFLTSVGASGDDP